MYLSPSHRDPFGVMLRVVIHIIGIEVVIMDYTKLDERSIFEQNKKLSEKFNSFKKLINELKNRKLPPEIINKINQDIDLINSISGSNKVLLKQIKLSESRILNMIEKEVKLVPKNHYRNMWLALGMSLFGVPMGVALGTSLGNMAFLGIGIPIGMTLGIAIGIAKDNEAKKNGNQLDIEII